MVNTIDAMRQETEDRTSFLWTFSTGASPWSTASPVFQLHDNRECNLVIEGTYTNSCVSRAEYKVGLKLVFNQEHTCYFNERFELWARLDDKRNEYKFKLDRVTERELSDEVLVRHHVSLSSRKSLEMRVELVCRTRHDSKNYSRLPFDNNVAGLSRDLQYLLDYGYQSDLDIEVGSELFKAHRTVLSCRSNVLAKMIEHDMLERRTGRIILREWDPRVMRGVLGYIYTGKYDLGEETVHEVFRLAHYLELHDLQIQCKLFILLNLSVDSVADTLRLAYHDQYDMADVREAALRFVAANEAQCAANADLVEYLGRSLDIDSVGFVLRFANRHHLEDTLSAVMEFIKLNFKEVMANEDVKSYLVSEPHLLIKMLELPDKNNL